VPAETLTVAIPPFTTSEHPFFHEDDVTVKVVCESDMCGFELSEDDCTKRVYILGLKKDGRGAKGRQSCDTMQCVPARERLKGSIAARASRQSMMRRL